MRYFARICLTVGLTAALCASMAAQGPGSCGVHLDILANRTSTHAAIADTPGAPGQITGIPPGAPGNPYCAYADPGTTVTLRVSVPGSTLGPAPFGAGSFITIIWNIGTPNVGFPIPGFVPNCTPGLSIIVSVLDPVTFSVGGSIVDGIGFFGPQPATPSADPGHPSKLEVSLFYPPGITEPVLFQAVIGTPFGLAVSNGVSLVAGSNPSEISLVAGLTPCGAIPAADEGFAMAPTPPGFTFYGFPALFARIHTNGFLDFVAAPVVCDFSGTASDFGCGVASASASPRVEVNHFDADLTAAPPQPLVADLTVEIAPPGILSPTRTIVRWKNVPSFNGPPVPPALDTDYASMVCELWGADGAMGASRIVVVRQDIHVVTTLSTLEQVGIGPGVAAQGFGGPPPACASTLFPALFGAPVMSAPSAAIFMDNLLGSHVLSNLAVVFDPLLIGVPDGYMTTVF